MSKELTVTHPAPPERFSAWSSIAHFENAQRMAKVLSESSIVPENYKGKIAECVIALDMANRIGANPLAVMQNLYIVHGRPAWSSQFLISCVNASGKFSPLRYLSTGERGQDSWGIVAWAQDRSGERLESPEVTMGMAKAEGWVSKNGSKWKTMPDLMLRYRAATLFARLFAPELTMGLHTEEEIIDIAPVVTDPVARAKPVSDAPKFAPKPAPRAPDDTDQVPGAEAPPVVAAATPAPADTAPRAASPTALQRDLTKIRWHLKESGFTELALLNLWREAGLDDSLAGLDQVAEVNPAVIRTACATWPQTLAALKAAANGGAQ